MELTKTFDEEAYGRALEGWAWVSLVDKRPIFTSLFGHVFFETDDGCWWLDIERGVLERRWDDRARMEAELTRDEGEDEFLLGGLAQAASAAGLRLTDEQVYDFLTPPVLGGAYDVENLNAASFVVCLDLSGQIHEQIRNLPDGTSVRIELKHSRGTRLRRWRR